MDFHKNRKLSLSKKIKNVRMELMEGAKYLRKRYFWGIAIIIVISLFAWHRFYIVYPTNIASKLSLQLHVDKTNYVQAEPVRLTAFVVNNTDDPIKISYPINQRPFSISFYKSKDLNTWQNILEIPVPRVISICGSEIHLLPKRRILTIQPNGSLPVQEWMMDNLTTDLGHGQIEFVAKLGFNSLFSQKTNTIESNKLKIEYTIPQGKDKDAYALITSNDLIDTETGKFGSGFLSSGLVCNSGSHHGEPVYQYFLKNHASSIYAPYFQYTLAITHRHHRCKEYGESLKNLFETSPSDFPLLPEICIELLEYYYTDNDYPEMEELAQSKVIKQLNVLNPATRDRLDYMLEQIEWWPPDTPDEKLKAEEAYRTREAVKAASCHWLTEALLKTYGDHYRNELQFSNREPDQTTLYFYDKNIGDCIFITFNFNEESSLKEVRIYGPLASASVGPFSDLSFELENQLKLQKQDPSSVKIDAVLIGKTLEGKVFIKEKKKFITIIPHFTFHINDAP